MFEDAVLTALSAPEESDRATQLAQVLARFGHVYVSSVEMGGMKQIHSSKTVETRVRALSSSRKAS